MMKKFNLLIALALFAGTITIAPVVAKAQTDDKAAQQAEFERNWYDICYTKKDNEKCYQLSKELIDKYPQSQYKTPAEKNVRNYEQAKAWEKFQNALKAYYAPPQDANKLEQLFAAGEEYYKFVPDQQYIVGQLALAGAGAVLAQTYKNLDRVKGLAEKALRVFSAAAPPKDWKENEWTPLRELVLAQMNQYLGHYLFETKGNQDEALAYLTKATEIKNKDGAGWKDPYNYWLRAQIYSKKYEELRGQYDKLADDQKTGDPGKELLKQVNQLVDTKLIPEYARVIAAATKPEAKSFLDAAKPLFDSFWKYRTDAPDKAPAYLKAFEADPTVAGPEVPAKAETADLTAPAAPVAGATNVKVAAGSGVPGAAPGAKGAANGNGKAAPAKGKAKTKRRR